MPRALVTGATGFVGSHLVDLLLERGYDVLCTLRASSKLHWLEGKRFERLDVDFSKPLVLPDVDILFHVAGAIFADSWEGYLRGNRDLSVKVVEAARCRRFVHVSSLAAAGPGESQDETKPPAPISLYGKSKWEGEREVWARRGRFPVTVVRPPVVYGPRDMGLFDLYKAVSMGIRPEIGGPKKISIIHARDLAEGILRAAEAPEGANEVFYLANEEIWTIKDVLRMVERGLGVSPAVLRIPDALVRVAGGIAERGAKLLGKRVMFSRDKALEMTQAAWCCSPAKAARLLGWRAGIPIEKGMSETLAWYRAEGLLT